MAKMNRRLVLDTMAETGLVPIFYHPELEIAIQVIEACLEAGVRCIEFTNRGEAAPEVFAGIADRFANDDRLILGAGSIMDRSTARQFLKTGANFIVGPALKPAVAEVCQQHQVAYSPGCATATEIATAQDLGVELCKVFPAAQLGGPSFIRSILGPMPWSKLMPTGGLSPSKESVQSWILAGATCLGIGSSLVSKEAIAAGDFRTIQQEARAALGFIQEARGGAA